jgi:ATP-dependent helicase/nuclease subunit A
MEEPVDTSDRGRLVGDLDTTFFVEASAGTGKTRELVRRVVALVAADKLTMPGLAAITFTDAAAAELRDRVRRELAFAAGDQVTWSDAEHRERCLTASQQVDLAQISTIHAFAATLLRTFPLEAGLPPGFEVWDEVQRGRAFDDRFRAWLYDEVPASDDPTLRQALSRVLSLGIQPDRLKVLAQELQEQYDLLTTESTWERGAPPDAVAIANGCGRWLNDLRQYIPLATALGEEDPLVKELRATEFVARLLRTARDEVRAFDALQRLLKRPPSRQQGLQRNWRRLEDGSSPVTLIKDTLSDVVTAVTEALAKNRTAAIADLMRHLSAFTLTYARERKQRGVATFQDLLVWARDLLRDHPEVRRQAHGRIQRLLVDEFQDTDPLQAELIVYLAADPNLAHVQRWEDLLEHISPGKLFVVGDPKQSIYRFRRADIAVYQQIYAASAFQGGARASLVQTYRTVEPVTHWVNEQFSSEMQPQENVQPEYARLLPRPVLDGTNLDLARCGVRYVGGPADTRAGERWSREAEAIARIAHYAVRDHWPITVQEEGRWHVRPARYRDICVLLPTRTNLRRLERAFERLALPYRMESGSLVLFTQEVRELLGCLRAIEDPSDQVALISALRSSAYGCSDVDLLEWVEAKGRLSYLNPGSGRSGPVAEAFRNLHRFHQQRAERSAVATIEAFIRDRSLSLQAIGHPRPREAMRRLRYVAGQARKLASTGDTTLRAFVDWIDTLRQNERYDVESAVPDLDENAVRLLTIHGAKGREFPIVILSGLGGGPRPTDVVQLSVNYKQRRIEARISVGNGRYFDTSGFNAESDNQANAAEQLRLLYVSATRAREHLVLSLFHGASGTGVNTPAAAIWRRLGDITEPRPRPIGDEELAAASEDFDSPKEPVELAEVAPEEHLRQEQAWESTRAQLLESLAWDKVASPSSLAHEPEPHAGDDSGVEVQAVHRPTRAGTPLGTAVHAVLQWLDLASLANLEQLAGWAARQSGVDAHEVARLARLAAGSDPLQRAVNSGQFWREVPVGLDVDGVLLEGALDLLYALPDGSLSVVDYKTDHVAHQEVQQRANRYALQGAAYALAVSRVTGRAVSRVEFVFPAVYPDRSEVFTVQDPDLDSVLQALSAVRDQ